MIRIIPQKPEFGPTSTAKNMHGKLCLVTGATAGIGKQTAFTLARMGAKVILVGRNPKKTEETAVEIRQKTGSGAVAYLLADFSDQQQIRALADQYKNRFARLDVLVNNHGALFLNRQETVDGLEMTFAVNHLGYFLLTNLLLDVIKASAPARIAVVSSDGHVGQTLDFDDLQNERNYGGMRVYSQSKLANLYFTYELARRLAGTGVTVNAMHPGFVKTNIGANNFGAIGPIIKTIINLGAIKVEEGAAAVVYLVTSPDVEGVSGKYFVRKRAVRSSEVSYDEEAARRLWAISERLTGLAGS
jgi:retinol dehydrogenase-12